MSSQTSLSTRPADGAPAVLLVFAFASLGLSAAIFGFFYAWICSTMWGLDSLDPRVAITAMNGMNASVRNAVFAPAFFGTPVVLIVTGALAYRAKARAVAGLFLAAAVIHVALSMGMTLAVNVPMNRALLDAPVPEALDQAQQVWEAYSPRWQLFNTLRTVTSGVALLLCGFGIYQLGRR